jgi:hypothetical protein
MTLSTIPSATPDRGAIRAEPRATNSANDGSGARGTRPGDTAVSSSPVRPSVRAPQGVLPAEAPAGTDPALWSILTHEERVFFSRTHDTGPLTYSKMMLPSQPPSLNVPAALGRRVDVRV